MTRSDKTYCSWCAPIALRNSDGQPVICDACLRKQLPVEPPSLSSLLPPINPKGGKL